MFDKLIKNALLWIEKVFETSTLEKLALITHFIQFPEQAINGRRFSPSAVRPSVSAFFATFMLNRAFFLATVPQVDYNSTLKIVKVFCFLENSCIFQRFTQLMLNFLHERIKPCLPNTQQ